MKGRKRHIVTDTLGLVLSCEVHSAGIQDRDGAKNVIIKAKAKYPSIIKFFADSGYAGASQIWCFLTVRALLTISRKIVDQVGFKVIPKRWIVERTFGWLNNFRRMSKDYEHNYKTSEHIIYINMITLMLKKLTKP
ncbi:transposase [Rickettsia endosymbiont of Pantilius tunicatus]|uniref:transposase n=1 Tax=Rickettsia endosymbiont of Pantilius tunicatus TaxID=3066267 RepID=UPI00376EBECA